LKVIRKTLTSPGMDQNYRFTLGETIRTLEREKDMLRKRKKKKKSSLGKKDRRN